MTDDIKCETKDPNTKDPNTKDPNTKDSNTNDPNTKDPNTRDPNTEQSNTYPVTSNVILLPTKPCHCCIIGSYNVGGDSPNYFSVWPCCYIGFCGQRPDSYACCGTCCKENRPKGNFVNLV